MFIVFVWGNIACIDEFASVCSARAKKKWVRRPKFKRAVPKTIAV